VRFYKDYAGGKDLDVFSAHDDVYFGRYEEGVLDNEFSGNLVEVCPTGVFTDKTLKKHFTRKWDLTDAPSVCHQCGLGCNIIASERYGTIRRILSRYNGDVNGYFLCDRGRFGYEYINSDKRITAPVKKQHAVFQVITSEEAIGEIKKIAISAKKIIGIGSSKASLESNFLLRQLVGVDNFYAGIPNAEGKLIQRVIEILKRGKVKIPSLGAVKEYDAVFIIGEDVTNTAPMLALNLRQAAKNKPGELAEAMKIPIWNDAAIREVVQGTTGPFYVATAHATKLDEIATQTFRGHPDDIARLAYAVVHTINNQFPAMESDEPTAALSDSIAAAMLAAKRPLIVAGTSLFNEAILDAAATLACALQDLGKDAGLIYIVPEANSIGLSLMSNQFLDDAFEKAGHDGVIDDAGPDDDEVTAPDDETVIILENDLYERTYKNSVDTFFTRFKHIIVLDYLDNGTTRKATYILAAGTFAETDGTIINNEGRAQRFYQVHVPDNEVRGSWKWLRDISGDDAAFTSVHFDGIMDHLAKAFPDLQAITSIAPAANFRSGTQKIPREPHRYSGRTAMHADVDVSERKPPEDPDSALSFTMEGYAGLPPSAIIPFYWSPGWNSVQAINKYQIEVGGPLHDGNPGKRLFESSEDSKAGFGQAQAAKMPLTFPIPLPFSPVEGESLVLPLYHLFGSEALSAKGPAIRERIPLPYIALNMEDAARAGIQEGQFVEVSFNDKKHRLPVRLNTGLVPGTAGLPKGLEETAGCRFPFWLKVNSAKNGSEPEHTAKPDNSLKSDHE
jgi:NADH-quinone oxidoreductase subunit G